MRRTLVVLGIAGLTLMAGVAVITAQPGDRPDPVAGFFQAACSQKPTVDGQAGTGHVPTHFAAALQLTTVQLADIEQIAGEICTAMATGHERIHGVLTPEQRTKVQQMHGHGHGHGAVAAWFKKLHGGH